jgi:hypothetical protein
MPLPAGTILNACQTGTAAGGNAFLATGVTSDATRSVGESTKLLEAKAPPR